MCGRFTLTVDPAELKEAFVDFKFPEKFAPRFNIAPTQPVLAIPNDGKSKVDFFMWGLILRGQKIQSLATDSSTRVVRRWQRSLPFAAATNINVASSWRMDSMNGNPSPEQKPKRLIFFISRVAMSLPLRDCGMNGILPMVQQSDPAQLSQPHRTI